MGELVNKEIRRTWTDHVGIIRICAAAAAAVVHNCIYWKDTYTTDNKEGLGNETRQNQYIS